MEKPLIKSVTFWLGLAVAILPALIEYLNSGKFDTVSALTFALGLAVIVRRYIAEPAAIRGILK